MRAAEGYSASTSELQPLAKVLLTYIVRVPDPSYIKSSVGVAGPNGRIRLRLLGRRPIVKVSRLADYIQVRRFLTRSERVCGEAVCCIPAMAC